MKINVELSVVTGDIVRGIESYFPHESFKQRKQYDEYYCKVCLIDIAICVGDLIELSEWVKVSVKSGQIYISNLDG